MTATEESIKFCPNCGAPIVAGALQCRGCGQALAKRDDLARLWGTETDESDPPGSEIIDLYPGGDLSSQTTTPFSQTRPFDPTEFKPFDDEPPAKKAVKTD